MLSKDYLKQQYIIRKNYKKILKIMKKNQKEYFKIFINVFNLKKYQKIKINN